MVFISIFNNISVILWPSVLLVEETGVPAENYRPVVSQGQTLSHNVVSSTSWHKQSKYYQQNKTTTRYLPLKII